MAVFALHFTQLFFSCSRDVDIEILRDFFSLSWREADAEPGEQRAVSLVHRVFHNKTAQSNSRLCKSSRLFVFLFGCVSCLEFPTFSSIQRRFVSVLFPCEAKFALTLLDLTPVSVVGCGNRDAPRA